MGSELCKPENNAIPLVLDPKEKKHKLEPVQQPTQFGNTDASETDDGPTPLKEFIVTHSTRNPICASNYLSFQTSVVSDKQTPKIESVKVVKPKGGIQNKPNPRHKAVRNAPRCSIDIPNVAEFQTTIKEFVVTQKNMESYGRIEISQEKFIQLRKEDIKKFYKLEQVVGEGAYGSVHKAVCLKSREFRAIKIIKKEHLARSKKEEVFAELQLLKKMDHPNIIKLYQVFDWDNRYQVVTQFCDGGSIIDFIKSRSQFHEHVIQTILKQLLGCLNYLHTIRIVHRDIKLQNVVFIKKVKDHTATDDIQIKLLDFGTACKLTKPKMKCNELIGTVSYMAPEIIKGYFTDKCDLWSCGVIFYILLTSKSPFKCKKKEDTLQKILTHQIRYDESIWQQVSSGAKDLLKKLLEKDPYKRISADSALKHPWFNSKEKSKQIMKTSSFLKDLSCYYRQNNLISVLQTYLVFAKVNQEERKRINAMFKEFDHNQDGFIQKNQLIQAYKEYSMEDFNQEDIEFILNKIDKDNSGSINLNEFTSAVVTREKLWAKTALEEAFDYFDTDKTGYIEKNELAFLLAGSENEQIEQLLTELDVDKDKRISKDQFINYLLKQGCLY